MADPNDGWKGEGDEDEGYEDYGPDEDEGYEEVDENGEMVNQANNPYYLEARARQAERLEEDRRQAEQMAHRVYRQQRRHYLDQQHTAEADAVYNEIQYTTTDEFDVQVANLQDIVSNPGATDAERIGALQELERIRLTLDSLLSIYLTQEAQGGHQHRAMDRQQIIEGLTMYISQLNQYG
jgi:hypothetical protein